MISFHIEFSKIELEAILFAYEQSSEESFHYGSKLIVPADEAIVKKLNESASGIFDLAENEVNTIFKLINNTIKRKYKDAKYASSAEKSALMKVSEIAKLLEFRDISKRQANQIAELAIKGEESRTIIAISSKKRPKKQVVEQTKQIAAIHTNIAISSKRRPEKQVVEQTKQIAAIHTNIAISSKKQPEKQVVEQTKQIAAIHIDKKEDNRSIDEKIKAVKSLKEELTNINKEYTAKFNKIKNRLRKQ